MITLIIGGPNSGKSILAEDIACSYEGPRFYLATMKIMDDEGKARVLKHRKLRDGKGFITLEKEYDIGSVLPYISGKNATVLLECAANLVGNELYDNPDRPWSGDIKCVEKDDFAGELIRDIRCLADAVSNLVIVTNRYKTDDTADDMTRLYIGLLDHVNDRLIELADRVVEAGDANKDKEDNDPHEG